MSVAHGGNCCARIVVISASSLTNHDAVVSLVDFPLYLALFEALCEAGT